MMMPRVPTARPKLEQSICLSDKANDPIFLIYWASRYEWTSGGCWGSRIRMIDRTELKRIAKHRLQDARVLAEAGRFDGAAYICGYAVEIRLKARICQTLRWSGYPSTASEFQGYTSFRTHDLDRLLRLSGREEFVREHFFVEWSVASQWNPEMRYQSIGRVKKADALLMISAAEILRAKL